MLRLRCACSTTLCFCFLSFPCHFCCCWHVPSAYVYPLWRMMWASFFGLTLFSFVPSWIHEFAWHDCQTSLLGFHSSLSFFLWAFMAYLLLSCFAFISYCACGPACCYFLQCWPARLYSFPSFLFGLLWPNCFYFALLLPLLLLHFCLLLGLSVVGLVFIKNGYQQTWKKIPLLKSKFYILNISMVLITNSNSTYICNFTSLGSWDLVC